MPTIIRIIIWEDSIHGQIDNIWEFEVKNTMDGKFTSQVQSYFADSIEQLKSGKKVSIELVNN